MIRNSERLIFALDVADASAAKAMVIALGDAVGFYKIGLGLMASGDYFEVLDWLVARDKRVFADLKFYDIPATVAAAVRGLRGRGVTYLTVHGDRAIMAAAAAEKGEMGILAVTVLTSLDRQDLAQMGYSGELGELVLSRARGARETGCDGVIASGLEARAIRAALGPQMRIVMPGVRPPGAQASDDQKRVVDVAQAFRNGADHIVMGRPIRDAADPRAAALAVHEIIAGVFA